ncbi:MAG: PQQ-like beta-propeller repeat protein [Phycisphaerales bacterium]|nr:PQQ-like beta-propeller repeat protein [Phycisphaerales bacterium]
MNTPRPLTAAVSLVLTIALSCAANEEKKSVAETSGGGEVTFHKKPKPLPKDAVTEDWPRFLGSSHNAVSRETRLLKDFPAKGPSLVWEMKTGEGYATPSILGNRLVFFHRVGDEDRIDCLDARNGRRFWTFSYPCRYRDRYGFSGGPRSSPVLDENRVFVHSVEGKLHCLDLQSGNVVWKRDTSSEYKVPQDYFGVVSSPLVEGDLLIVNIGAPGGPCVVAYDKRTGKVVWQTGDQWGPSCASPVPAMVNGKRRVFVFAGGDSRPPTGGLLNIDPAHGKIEYRVPFRSKTYESVNASCPVIVDDRVFLSSSYNTGGLLLDAKTGKDVWCTRDFGAHFMTPIHKDGYLYGIDGSGGNNAALTCIDLRTGKAQWRTQPNFEENVVIQGEQRNVTYGIGIGSLLHVDGRFLCLSEYGHLLWLDLSPSGSRQLARTWLFSANQTWGLPVLSRGLLYINQNTKDTLNQTAPRLLCYDLRAEN